GPLTVVCFFSSRRRHTSSKRDWSSDVCSSDLTSASKCFPLPSPLCGSCIFARFQGGVFLFLALLADFSFYRLFPRIFRQTGRYQIGRASCRERVGMRVDVATLREIVAVWRCNR